MSDNVSFAEQIDAVLDGKYGRYDDLKVCDTPKILQQIGLQNLPMLYTQKHLKYALHQKSSENPHYHGLTIEQTKKLPELIEAPAMIFDSISNDSSIVLVTDMCDDEMLPIIISIRPNGIGMYGSHKQPSNFITSVYGKNDITGFVNRTHGKDCVLYFDKTKSQALFRVLKLQLPQGVNNLDSNIIIHQSRNIVNTKGENFIMPKKYFLGDIVQIKHEGEITNQYVVIEAGKDSLSCFLVSSGNYDEKTHVRITPDERNKLQADLCVKADKIIKIDESADLTLSSARLSAVDVQKFIEKHNTLNTKAKAINIKQSTVKTEIVDRAVSDIGENFKLAPETIADYMAYRANFTQYSALNQLRIYAQNRHATFVKTYRQWSEMGHKVIKKGAIQLLQPAFTEYFKDENGDIKKVSEATNYEKAAIAKGDIETWVKKRFDTFNVFDISQTDCPVSDYPKFYAKGFESKQHSDIYKVLRRIAENNGITVSVEDVKSISLHGYYSPGEDKIVLSDKLNDTELMHTMSHEFAHALMHKTTTQSRSVCEFEADCLSAQLSAKFGLELSAVNKHHLACAFREIGEDYNLNESFERVHKAFSFVEKSFESVADDMGISFDIEQDLTATAKGQDIEHIPEAANFSEL